MDYLIPNKHFRRVQQYLALNGRLVQNNQLHCLLYNQSSIFSLLGNQVHDISHYLLNGVLYNLFQCLFFIQ